jgi:hypothetical protein
VHRYALPRLPHQTDTPSPTGEPAFAMVTAGGASGIIEID